MAVANVTANGTFLADTKVNGEVMLTIAGTLGGATIEFQRKYEDGTYRTIPNGSYTVETEKLYRLPNKTRREMQAVVTGATAPNFVIEISE